MDAAAWPAYRPRMVCALAGTERTARLLAGPGLALDHARIASNVRTLAASDAVLARPRATTNPAGGGRVGHFEFSGRSCWICGSRRPSCAASRTPSLSRSLAHGPRPDRRQSPYKPPSPARLVSRSCCFYTTVCFQPGGRTPGTGNRRGNGAGVARCRSSPWLVTALGRSDGQPVSQLCCVGTLLVSPLAFRSDLRSAGTAGSTLINAGLRGCSISRLRYISSYYLLISYLLIFSIYSLDFGTCPKSEN